MVVAADREPLADQRRDPAAADGPHVDGTVSVAPGAVALVPDQVGGVLVEHAAGVHRHDLHPAAHPEHRQAGRLGGVEQRELPGVAVGAPLGGARVRLRAVAGRVDVGPAAHHERVQPRHHDIGSARLGDRRQQHRYAAGRLDRGGVLRGQHVGPLLPDPPGRLFAVGRQPDQWRGHVRAG